MLDGLVHPTPLIHAPQVSAWAGVDVWVKREDLSHARYGGNKVRKLGPLLEDARRCGATDVITVGALGSHHVLATCIHGAAAGFRVHAVLTPQPWSAHAEGVLRATLASAASVTVEPGWWRANVQLRSTARRLRQTGRAPYVIPLGGSSRVGASGCAEIGREIAAQSATLAFGGPLSVLLALGSGGTAAGLLDGLADAASDGVVLGARVTPVPVPLLRAQVWRLRDPVLRRRAAGPALHVWPHAVGAGYGVVTAEGQEAAEAFARDGLVLDGTYTAKAAATLRHVARTGLRTSRWVFVHTLSASSASSLPQVPVEAMPAALAAAFLRPGGTDPTPPALADGRGSS